MYASISKLEDRITAALLAQRVTETGEARTRVLTYYLDTASAVMDAYICVRYETPAPSSALLDHIALCIALWCIEGDRGSAFAASDIPPSIQRPYDEAMKMLQKIADGDIRLAGASAPSQNADSAAGLDVVSPPALFSPGSPGMEFF